MKKLFLIDAYALIFKYYYAFYGRPMRNRAGMNTSIVFGFTKFLRDIIKREKPEASMLGLFSQKNALCAPCPLMPAFSFPPSVRCASRIES